MATLPFPGCPHYPFDPPPHKIFCLSSSKAERTKYKTGPWDAYRKGVFTPATHWLVDLWLRRWMPLSECLQKVHGGAVYHGRRAVVCVPGAGVCRSAQSVPIAAAESLPNTTWQSTHIFFFRRVCYFKKSWAQNCWESLLLFLTTGSKFSLLVVFLSSFLGIWWCRRLGPVILLFHGNPSEWDTWHPVSFLFKMIPNVQ